MTARTAYLDASAAVKLLSPESETEALVAAIESAASRVSSELLEVELRCVARRQRDDELLRRVDVVLSACDLIPYTQAIRERAGSAFTPAQRALDAVHLATALDLRLGDLVFLTYDRAQAQGGASAGLEVETPV